MASSFTPAALVAGSLLAASITTLYTVPASTKAKISQLTVTNTDATTAHKVVVYLASSSASATAKDQICTVVLAPLQSFSVYQALNVTMEAGGTIQASCDADSLVTLKASGTLIT